jgi:vacuolar protein-sorting-associated protein 4
MAGKEGFLKRAIDAVQEAIRLDDSGDPKAFDAYMRALELFAVSQKWETNPITYELVQTKRAEYTQRAEDLKGQMEDERRTKVKEKDEDGSEKEKLYRELESVVLVERPNVRWEDVAGLETAKDALKEAVLLPQKLPELFESVDPWMGVLLFGPPGTGKSHLAKALACESDATFFSVSAADLISKWLGQSERLLAALFEMARDRRPSIIFVDEVDSLFAKRSEGGSSDGADRVKAEFLRQMQSTGKGMRGVFILGATNIPWVLDPAVRRRFEKRIYVPLPAESTRAELFRLGLRRANVDLGPDPQAALKCLARETEGYSGADISIVVREALMQPIRTVQSSTHFRLEGGKWSPCSPGDERAEPMTWEQIPAGKILAPAIALTQLRASVQKIKPSVDHACLIQYQQWTDDYGIECK